ncbi:HIT family protein [Halobacillus rhizosphaerae]|uniref:HIT family protein n=1 Tax=Halobacillus rhizosphaerae TaxID=3064889 RepID=UPI00398B1B71
MDFCIFCHPSLDSTQKIILQNDTCVFLQKEQRVLIGSGLIVPKAHRETVFDMTEEEWVDSKRLLEQVKQYQQDRLNPDGYNVGYNCGQTGGQHIFHAHMHVIPRFSDEPHAGKGIRHWLKQSNNKRT